MAILHLSSTTPLVGFNGRFAYMANSNEMSAMCRLLGRNDVSMAVVEAARSAVCGLHTSSVNMLWAQHTWSPTTRELRSVPYISSLMWARILASTNASEEDIIQVLNMPGLPAYWGLATMMHCEGVLREQANHVEYIRSLAEHDNYAAFHAAMHERRGNPETRSRTIPAPTSVAPRRVMTRREDFRTAPTPVAPVRVIDSPYIFQWVDTEAPVGTVLSVTRWGSVCYKYGGSYADSGTGDMAAVRRAVRQWRKWEKPEGLELFCHPARPRLAEFYRLFPEVEIR